MFGVFRVKNHDFTPKNHIFFNFRGARAGCAPPPPPPADPPLTSLPCFMFGIAIVLYIIMKRMFIQ